MSTTLLRPDSDRAAWLAERQSCITATDVAAILGIHPYKSPHEVWLEKKGELREKQPSEVMLLGLELEPTIAAMFGRRNHVEPEPAGFVRHPEAPHFGATPDYLIGETSLLECKWAGPNAARNFGESESDHVPDQYLCQVMWQLFVTGRRVGYLAVLLPTGYRQYTIARDDDLIRRMAFGAEKFWREYVCAECAPPIGATRSDTEYLNLKHPMADGSVVVATPEIEAECEALSGDLGRLATMQEIVELRKNRIKAFMGNASVLETPLGKFRWEAPRPAARTDWKSVAHSLGVEIPQSLIDDHTTRDEPTRRFTTPFRTNRA